MADRNRSRAIVQHGKTLNEEEVTLPALAEHEILVRVHYAALNPTDVLAFDLEAFGDGAVLGCDFAGTVEQLGSGVSNFAVGDNVAAFIWGGEVKGLGSFSEFCVADARIAFKVPASISLEQAATIPLAATTSWLALFSSDCLGIRGNDPPPSPVMILGGAYLLTRDQCPATVGSFANQIAAAYNISTVSTCSKKNAEAVLQDGPKDVFDYHEKDMVSQVLQKYPDITYIFDTIGTPASSTSVGELFGEREGKLCTVRPGKAHCDSLKENVSVSDVFVFTVFPKAHDYRGKLQWAIHPENCDLGREFNGLLPELISSGKLKPKAVRSLGRLGPESVLKGMELIRSKAVSGEKICFSVLDRFNL